MLESSALAAVLSRLRTNLEIAGIAASEETLQGISEKGFLQTPAAFDALAQRMPFDLVPDYLAAWEPGDESAAGQQLPSENLLNRLSAPANSIVAVAEQIRSRAISPVELTEQALARLAERDPLLNAFQLVLAEQALTAARRAEQEIMQGSYRGPLHGVPVAIKDLLIMAGTPTTAGSKILADHVTDDSATAVERLEAAGAIIIGKTRMAEFAYAAGSVNGHYGPTHNPHALERDSGGSSSGSAAAVADEIVCAALGSDTGGSIRMPAALCGIVGLKPTFGRVSLHGAVTLSWSLDHLGPLTRCVADAALLLALLAGSDPRDARTRPGSSLAVEQLVGTEPTVRGLRIGVLRDDGSGKALAQPDVLAAWQAGLAALEGQGAELVEVDLPELNDLRVVGGTILAMEALAYHQPMLRTRLDDYGEFMRQRILTAYAYDTGAFVAAQQLRSILRRRCTTIFERVDLLSTPTVPAGAPPLGALTSTAFTIPFNLLGWPAISVPVGATTEELPVGLQLIGRPWDEATVLRVARALEIAKPLTPMA
jgi:aspartyl-tRNA(Asn)/glutamyl-tRNA(Gln) amidotransferase subunit A